MKITEPERAIFRRIKKALGKLLDATAPTRAETLKKADITPNAYNIAMRRGSLRLIWIIRLLNFCGGGDLARFFAGALADDEPEPPELKTARRRIADTEQAEPSADVWQQLAELATLAREKPASAVALARELVEVVQLEDLPRVLALCGTAYRFQEYHAAALANLRQALKWERAPARRADLRQRMAYVFAAQQKWDQAHHQVIEAQTVYLQQGIDSKVGETFVDRGMIFYHQGNFEGATVCNHRALEFLGRQISADQRHADYVFTAYHGLAICGHDVDENLAKAAELSIGELHRSKLTWFRAEAHEREGRFSDAFHLILGLALSYLDLEQNLNACWATTEAARLSLLISDDTEQLARVIARLTFTLPEKSATSAALARLWVAMTSPAAATREDIVILVGAVKTAIKRERLEAARALPT